MVETSSLALSCQQPYEHGLLNVHPIGCLLDNCTLRAVDDFVGDFVAAMGRQAMKKGGFRVGFADQFTVDLVIGKRLNSFFFFRFLSHADPDVGVHGVRPCDGGGWIVHLFHGVWEFVIELLPTSNLFLSGHRIRVDISSSDFPNHDRNHNTGGDDYFETDLQVARQTVFHDATRPTRIVLPVIPTT